ncbi:MAG: phenylalanine--tRNA ligase beta subunit-related protein [bacterium]
MKIPINWLQDYVKIEKSPKEIAESFTALGLMLDKPLGDGKVLDLEHRMDRSDWLSIIGCARDLAALENIPLKLPKGYGKVGKKATKDQQIPITVECDEVRRFTTRIFRGVQIKKSPKWLSERLLAYGLKSINNVVDITNYVMVEYGQPLHAQDLDKLPANELTWRNANQNEKLTTFLGTQLILDPSAFVISSGGKPIVLGGIIGGAETGVTDTTTDFILDSGNYDQRSIRTTSRKQHINNETVLRTDKFLDPRAVDLALSRATELILELAGGTYYDNSDYYPHPVKSKSMTLRLSRLHLLSGIDFTLVTAKKILTALDYVVVEQTSTKLTVEIPYFRTDVEVEDDLVADILRIYNYKNIPIAPLTTPVPTDITPAIYRFEDRLRDILASLGADEHITGSLVEKDEQGNRIILENALTREASALRLSLAENLASVLSTYQKHGVSNVVIFEIGITFSRDSLEPSFGSIHEHRNLTAMSNSDIRPILSSVMHELVISYDLTSDHNIVHNNQVIGTFNLQSFTLDTERSMSLSTSYQGVVSEYSHTTSIDISLTLSQPTNFDKIKPIIIKASKSLLMVEVLESKYPSLLLRLTWDENTEYLKEKAHILTLLLTKLAITSRSV